MSPFSQLSASLVALVVLKKRQLNKQLTVGIDTRIIMSKPDWMKRIGTSWEPEYVISSGSVLLDNSPALSNYKGIPSGVMIQIASKKEGSFKTSLALAGAKELQKQGKKVVFIDAEAGLTGLDWIKANGLSTDKELWTYAQPEDGEEAFTMAEYFIKDKEHYGIIIDSIDSCQPSKIMTSEFGDANIGNHAKLVTQAVRKFKTQVRTHQKIMWLVNQMRVNITQMGARGHKSTGGDAIDFYCKLNIEMSKDKSDNQLKDTEYIPLSIGVKRSKLGLSYTDVNTYALQGKGIDQEAELVHLAIDKGIIYKSGSWYKHNIVDNETGEVEEVAIGQGIEKARDWCIEHKEEILK